MICSSLNRFFISLSFGWADSTSEWRSFFGAQVNTNGSRTQNVLPEPRVLSQPILPPKAVVNRLASLATPPTWNLKARCDRFLYLSLFSSSLNASVGVRHPKHFLGVMFMRSQIDFISRFESAATGASRRKYRLARLFKFSTEPFRQGACGSQNQASVPIPGLSLRQFLNSIPRSNVIDLRAG